MGKKHNKTGGGAGTNQYAVRGTSKAANGGGRPAPKAELMAMARGSGPQCSEMSVTAVTDENIQKLAQDKDISASLSMSAPEGAVDRRRCGEVWGTPCMAMVAAPDYIHSGCPTDRNKVGAVRMSLPLPLGAMRYLAQSDDPNIRYELTYYYPDAPEEVMAILAADPEERVRRGAARHATTPGDALRRLAYDDVASVRSEVAMNPRTPIPALDKLSQDDAPAVRTSAAGNPSATPTILERLATDNEPRVRLEVARNPAAEPETLNRLAQEKDLKIDIAVANNPSTPTSTLRSLLDRSDPKNLNCSDILSGIASNPNALPDTLDQLASLPIWGVRVGVARNPNASPAALTQLAKDNDPLIQQTIIENPSTPSEALGHLILSGDSSIAEQASQHPHAPLPAVAIRGLSQS